MNTRSQEARLDYRIDPGTRRIFILDKSTNQWYLRNSGLHACSPPRDVKPLTAEDDASVFQMLPCGHVNDPYVFNECKECVQGTVHIPSTGPPGDPPLLADLAPTIDLVDEQVDEVTQTHSAAVKALTCEMKEFVRNAQQRAPDTGGHAEVLLDHYRALIPLLDQEPRVLFKRAYPLETLLQRDPGQRQIHLLSTSNEQLKRFIEGGHTLPNNAGLILIRGDLQMPDVALDTFIHKITNGYAEDVLEGQNYLSPGSGNVRHGILELVQRYRQRSRAPEMTQIGNESIPRNMLSVKGSLGAHVAEPLSVQILLFTLLDVLNERVERRYRRIYSESPDENAGKEQSVPNWLTDATACLRFCLMGERGSSSLNHLDILNGTWVTCLSGIKLWFVYDGPWNEDIRKKFKDEGSSWVPVGQMRPIVLRPGDTLIMRPGYPIVHSVLTLEDSVMVGGMIWSQDDLVHCMENIKFIMSKDHYRVTNEHIPRQLPMYLDELYEMAIRVHTEAPDERCSSKDFVLYKPDQLAAIQSAKLHLMPVLSCAAQCMGSDCGNTCPCRKGNSTRVAGCTVWCHDNDADFRDPRKRCKWQNVPVAGPPPKPGCDCASGCGTHRCRCWKAEKLCGINCHKRKGKGACTQMDNDECE